MKKNNWKTSTITLSVLALLLTSILFFQYGKDAKEMENRNYDLTEEQKATLLCPFYCIDAGYSYGSFCKGIKKCVCEK